MATKRNKGFLVPSVINPPGRRCVQIWIPDQIQHIANFWGVLNFLTLWTEYERTGNDDGAQVANVWKEVYLSARQYFETGDCQLPLELRNNEGIIEWRPDSEASWQSLGEACPCPPVITSPEYNQSIETFEQRACNIAVGLVNWIMDKFNDSIDQIEAIADTVSSFDAIVVLFPPAYLIADTVLDMIDEVVEAGVNTARAFDTETVRDQMKQYLYCSMFETGELTEEIWLDFIQWANDEYNHFPLGAGWACWDFFVRMLDVNAVLARARIVSYEDADCVEFPCNTWTHTFDFVAEDSKLGWVIEQGSFSDSFNSAYLELSESDFREMVQIKRAWDDLRELVTVTVEGTKTGVPGGASEEFRLRGYNEASQVFQVFSSGFPPGEFLTATEPTNQVNIRLQVQQISGFSGCDLTINKVIIQGIGTDPFL